MGETEFIEKTFSTLIVTNNTEYLDQCVDSAINPVVVYDSIPVPENRNHYALSCNASRPSIARNVGLENINRVEFIQLLDSDDFLSDDYFDTILPILSQNPDFDIFYTDYTVLNEDFNFSNREYLKSIGDKFVIDDLFKVKNPIIRGSAIKDKKFDANLTNSELIDFMLQIGTNKMYHIPLNLQTVRIHPKSYSRISDKKNQKQSLDIIYRRIHGKI